MRNPWLDIPAADRQPRGVHLYTALVGRPSDFFNEGSEGVRR
jgi:hypothetical protein